MFQNIKTEGMYKNNNNNNKNSNQKYNQQSKKAKKQEDVNEFQPVLNPDQHRNADAILDRTQWLGNEFQAWRQRRSDWRYVKNEGFHFFEEWLPYYIQSCEVDLLAGKLKLIQVPSREILRSPSEEVFFKSYNFFKDYPWSPRFSKKFLRRFQELNLAQKKLVVGQVGCLLDGQIFGSQTNTVYAQELNYMKFFITKLTMKRALLWFVGVERIPELTLDGKSIRRFDYVHYMRFHDILTEKDLQRNSSPSACATIIQEFKKDPARQDFGFLDLGQSRNPLFDKVDVLTGTAVAFVSHPNSYVKYYPNEFKPTYLSTNEASTIVYNSTMQRWVSRGNETILESAKFNNFIAAMNQETLRKYADFKNAVRLVELLEKIPNFKLKLTPEEKEVVGQNGNVLALGRSGTGKTTCAILRLFSMEILFKYRLAMAKQKYGNILQDTRFNADDVDNNIGLHCIFVTASPVLTNEVSRYYHKLTDQVKDELNKKQQRVRERKAKEEAEKKKAEEEKVAQEAKEKIEVGFETVISTEKVIEDPAVDAHDEIKMAEEQLRDIKLEKQLEIEEDPEDELMDENTAEDEIMKRMNQYSSLKFIDERDFPLFLTVRRLVLLIDGTLQRPFFARNMENQIIGTDTNAQWHNEMKGVLMISNYHKKLGDFEETLDAAKKDRESDIEDSEDEYDLEGLDEEDVEEEYMHEINADTQIRRRKHLRDLTFKRNQLSFEVEYDYFVTNFWNPIVMRKYPYLVIPPIVVWSEIQSYIKGSANAHEYPGSYVPKYIYMQLDKKKTFLSSEMKEIIFDLFGMYERWKRTLGAYDFMDVVNYVLNQIKFRGYDGVPIHYLMIDEVQDLTHATILLLMKVTEQGLFFSGDTAQTIAKGVGVRFSDLTTLFQLQQEMTYGTQTLVWKKPTVRQLTVNFRSHGKILDVANSVVTLIETFFPNTIDKLKKEKSNIDGPKPILLDDVKLDVLFALLFGNDSYKSERHSSNKENKIEFGCNQVILVRDQASKAHLPPLLQHALVLTIYEAKGLEFDDVILYDFFADSQISHTQWNLLNSIYYEDVYVDKEEYEKSFFTFDSRHLDDLNNESDEENEGDDKQKDPNEEKVEETKTDKPKPNSSEEYEKKFREEMEEKRKREIQERKAMRRLKGLDANAVNLFNATLDTATNKYLIKKIQSNKNVKSFNMTPYSLLCTELKMLYVAITRPRNRLIIYDSTITPGRKVLQTFWKDLNLVQPVNMSTLISKEDEPTDPSTSREIQSFRSLVSKTNKEEWKKQGIRMFKNKYYEQAIKCFDMSEDKEYKLRATAYYYAEKASSKMSEISSKRTYLEEGIYPYNTYNKNQRKDLLKALRHDEKTVYTEFDKAGGAFLDIGLLKQAGQCFFSAKNYERAYDVYVQLGQFKQAGECCSMLGRHSEAAELFDKGGDYVRAIDSYALLKRFDDLLECVNRHKEIPPVDRETYAKKFVPLALESLLGKVDYNIVEMEENKEEIKKKNKNNYNNYKIKEVEEEDEDDLTDSEESKEENQDEEAEMNEEQVPQQNNEEVVDQQGPDQQGQASEPDQIMKEPAKIVENPNQQQEQINQSEKNAIEKDNKKVNVSEISFEDGGEKSAIKAPKKDDPSMSFEIIKDKSQNVDIGEISFDDIQSIKKEKKKSDNVSEMSFESINSANIKADKIEKLDNFEHLNHIDPEDEWLKMETGSIVESISEVRRQGSVSYSEFSAVDFNHVMNNHCTIVKTKADIFVQDEIMSRIIRYVGMFSDEVKKSLLNIRSKKSLLSSTKQPEDHDAIVDYIIDMDDITIEFVYLVLDLLEHYKLYKLCIFVCNRYGLSQKIGRYLVNIASKYSNFSVDNMAADNVKVFNKTQRQIQGEKAFVANIAFHNVLENISPNFLKLKKKNEIVDNSNSLGYECYSELINLGFWKKILFLMDYKNSLALASTYASFKNYKLIFVRENSQYVVQGLEKKLEKEDFEFLPFKTPNDYEEMKCCYVALDAVLWDLTEKFPFFLNKNYKPDPKGEIVVPEFVSFFAFNGIFWNFLTNHNPQNEELFEKYLNDGLSNLVKIMKNSDFKSDIIELRIYDLITLFIEIILYYNSVPALSDKILLLSDEKFEEMLSIFKSILVMTKNILRMSKYQETIMKALITCFRVRYIDQAPVLEHLCGSYYLVHISSPLVSEILSQNNHNDSTNTAIIFDLDANFIACPINTVLDAVRSKIINSMRSIMTGRMKWNTQTTYDDTHERMERHLHVLGMVEAYRYAADFNNLQPKERKNKDKGYELKYKKTDPLYQYAKSDLKIKYEQLIDSQRELDQLEANEREILAKRIDSELKQLRATLKINDIKSAPYEDLRKQIFRSVKSKSNQFRNVLIHLSPFTRQSVLDFLLQKMKSQFHKQKVKPNYINLFFMLGEEVYFMEYLRRNNAKWCSKDVQHYFDAIFFRKYLCIDEYAHELFEYFSKAYKILKLGEKIQMLFSAAPSLVIQAALGQKKKMVYLTMDQADLLEDTKITADKEFTWTKDILPAEGVDNVFELIYWTEKICTGFLDLRIDESEYQLKKLERMLFDIALTVLLNVKITDPELALRVNSILRMIIGQSSEDYNEYEFIAEIKTAESMQIFAKNFNFKSHKFIHHSFVKVVTESNSKKAEKNIEVCNAAYDRAHAKVASHIILKRRIMKIYNSRRFSKIKQKIALDFFTNNYLMHTFRGLASYKFVVFNIYNLMKKNSGLLEIFFNINDILKSVIHYFYTNKISNPIDFHYVMCLLRQLGEVGLSYSDFIREWTINQDFSQKNQEIFVKKKNELNSLVLEFNVWKQSKELKENLDDKMKKKKKVLGVKWEERAVIGRMTKYLKAKTAKKKGANLKKNKKQNI